MNNRRKKILAVYGSTGSIGTNTLNVVREQAESFEIRYLTANSNSELLCAQIREFRPRSVAVFDPHACERVRREAGNLTEVLCGIEGLLEIAGRDDYDTMVSALVGFAGMLPTITAIKAGKHIALANKETLVVAGALITGLVESTGVTLQPIDSEHSAILQCLCGEDKNSVSKLILTASGGPFRGRSRKDLETVTLQDALDHPNWKMGSKITIDSATLMNKGLEVIEAHWLFGIAPSDIDVVVHPQSIIHSMVEFHDGSIKAQLGVPDMKIPIQYALSYPDRYRSVFPRIDFQKLSALTFEEPDKDTFRCLQLAYDALDSGGTSAAILNAANEVAVHAFLEERIAFHKIPELIESCLSSLESKPIDSVDAILEADRITRNFAIQQI